MRTWDNFDSGELELISIKNLCIPMGLQRLVWEFSRGAKITRRYMLGENEAINVHYTYQFKNGLRDIESYSEHIEFLQEDGSIFHVMDVPTSFNITSLERLNREIRQGRIDYLKVGAQQLSDGADQLEALAATMAAGATKDYYLDLAEDYRGLSGALYVVLAHYAIEIDDYIKLGTLMFENAVLNETDPTMLTILGLTVRQPDEKFPVGLTAKTSIIHQLTGTIPSE